MIKKLAALCLFSAVTATAHASVVVDTAVGLSTTSSISFMTIGTGINRMIVVECSDIATAVPSISSVTIGASSATFTLAVKQKKSTTEQSEIWYYLSPPSGSQNIQVNSGIAASRAVCGAVSLFNVNLSTPIDVSSGTITASSVAFTTTVSSDMIIDMMANNVSGDTLFVPAAGQTLQWGTYNAGLFTGQTGSTKLTNFPGLQSMSWTTTGIGVEIAIAVEGSTSAPNLSSFSPASVGINTGAFTLTINGDHFVSGSTVSWNGSQRATTFLSSNQLTIAVSTTDIAAVATVPIFVTNPDGGTSAQVSYSITGDVTYVWATDGGYKPTRDDLYGINHSSIVTTTRIWDGTTITPFQGLNEINGFALVLENGTVIDSTGVSVGYPVLTGPGGYVISSTPAVVSTLWDWRNRPIEVYLVRYLQITGLTRTLWDTYDERQVPLRMQAPYTIAANGQAVRTGGWTDRPDHAKYYPDPLIPMEAVTGSTFTVYASSSQAIWIDIYTAKNAPAGIYTGSIPIYEGGTLTRTVPISMTVYPVMMPDKPYAKAWADVGQSDTSLRHHGNGFPTYGGIADVYTQTRMHYYQLLHRFGLNPVGDGLQVCGSLVSNSPCPEFQLALSGSLYAQTTGYANAPGIGTPDTMYSMFTYGGWSSPTWLKTYASTCQNASTWVQWFQQNYPKAEFWWYIADEPSDLTLTNTYSSWISTCPSPGNLLQPFVTAHIGKAYQQLPNIGHIATNQALGSSSPLLQPADMENALRYYTSSSSKALSYYGNTTPFTGTWATEDDGIAPRVKLWSQYKKHFDHYFVWETNFWKNADGGGANTNVYNTANTFGFATAYSVTYGTSGFNAANGDGVLIYPGTDVIVSTESYGADTGFPSWRLMMLRRGINDFSLLTMASKYDSATVNTIVSQIIPKVMWEYGVVDTADPTYQFTGPSWSNDPNVWEVAREKLYKIIINHR